MQYNGRNSLRDVSLQGDVVAAQVYQFGQIAGIRVEKLVEAFVRRMETDLELRCLNSES
jgi:hypothetical protein